MREPRHARWVVEKDQVDIARIIKLPAAQLAHCEDNEAAAAFGIRGVDRCDRAVGRGNAQHIARRRTDRRLGEAAERGHLLFKRPASGKLGDRAQQGETPLGDPQPSHQRRPIFAAIGVCLGRRDNFLEQRIGAFLDDAGEELPFGDGEAAQKRAVAEDRGEQAFAGRGGAPLAGKRGAAFVLRLGEGGLPGRKAERQKPRIRGQRQPVTILPARMTTLAQAPSPVKGWDRRSRLPPRMPCRAAAGGCTAGRCAMSGAVRTTSCAGSARSPRF